MFIFSIFSLQTLIVFNAFKVDHRELCSSLLNLDKSIRFTAIAKFDGKISSTRYREGLVPLLTKDETELSIMQSLIRMSIRRTLEDKLGKTKYSVTVYEKVTRATISLFTGGGREDDLMVLISFDKTADHERIIKSKILPFLMKKGNVTE